MTWRAALTLAFLLPVAAGCAAFKAAPAEKPAPWKKALSIAGEAVVSFTGKEDLRGRALILAKSPASFRIEIKGAFGVGAAVISSDGQKIFVSSKGSASVYAKGQDNPDMPYNFEPEELVTLLLGAKNLDAAEIKTAFKGFDAAVGSNGEVTSLKREDGGKGRLTVLFSGFKDVDGALFPHAVTATDGRETLSIKYTKIEINPAVEESAFDAPDSMGVAP